MPKFLNPKQQSKSNKCAPGASRNRTVQPGELRGAFSFPLGYPIPQDDGGYLIDVSCPAGEVFFDGFKKCHYKSVPYAKTIRIPTKKEHAQMEHKTDSHDDEVFIRTKDGEWYVCELRGAVFVTWVTRSNRDKALPFPRKDSKRWIDLVSGMSGMDVEAVPHSNADEIKPCPFCGSRAVGYRDIGGEMEMDEFIVVAFCGACGAQGPHSFTKIGAKEKWDKLSR
jgi:Lar family restriction alleviation protein